MAGVIIAEVKAGAGRHMEYIDPQDFVRAMHLNFSTQPTVFAALGLARLSVCFFLLRFAPTRWVKWTIHISAAASTFITIFGIGKLVDHMGGEQNGLRSTYLPRYLVSGGD